MKVKIIRLSAVLCNALALAPALAHALELPNKITLAREDYMTVQQIYRGWDRLAFVVIGALLSTFVLAARVRTQSKPFVLTVLACLCLVGT